MDSEIYVWLIDWWIVLIEPTIFFHIYMECKAHPLLSDLFYFKKLQHKTTFWYNFQNFQNDFDIVESFHNNCCAKFLSNCKLNKIHGKKKAKSVSTFDLSTSYTTIPHKLQMKVFSQFISFVFKSKIRKRIGFSKTSIYWLLRELEEHASLNNLL